MTETIDTTKSKKRDKDQLKELVNEYVKSGLTVMEFCKEHKEAPPTLVKHLEYAGYRMTLETAKGCSDSQAENDRLFTNYINLLKKYEPEKYKTAMLACLD